MDQDLMRVFDEEFDMFTTFAMFNMLEISEDPEVSDVYLQLDLPNYDYFSQPGEISQNCFHNEVMTCNNIRDLDYHHD